MSKTKNRTKKIIQAKIKRKINFWAPKTLLLDAHSTQTRYEILCPYLVSAHSASFMSRWPLLRGGVGVCISLVGTGPQFCSITAPVPINGMQEPPPLDMQF